MRPCFHSLWYMPRGGIARSYDKSIFNFWGIALLFSIAATPFYIPTSSTQEFSLSAFSSTLVVFQGFFVVLIAILMDVNYLIVVFICIFLVMLSIFSCAHWLFVYLLWHNVSSSPLPIFESDCLVFCCCCCVYSGVLRILYTRYYSCQICGLHMCSPSM